MISQLCNSVKYLKEKMISGIKLIEIQISSLEEKHKAIISRNRIQIQSESNHERKDINLRGCTKPAKNSSRRRKLTGREGGETVNKRSFLWNEETHKSVHWKKNGVKGKVDGYKHTYRDWGKKIPKFQWLRENWAIFQTARINYLQ